MAAGYINPNTLVSSYQYQYAHASQDKGPEIRRVTIAFMALSSIAVALRLIARTRACQKYGSDDYTCVIALARPAAPDAAECCLTI
jgi:hypothetical protein